MKPLYRKTLLRFLPIVFNLERANQLSLLPDKDLADLCPLIEPYQVTKNHHFSDADHSKTVETFLWNLGSWIPGSKNPSKMWGNIGSYSGKETMLLIGWLVSWPILHYLWKDRQIKAKTILFWFFALMIAATAMSWHPLFPYLPLT